MRPEVIDTVRKEEPSTQIGGEKIVTYNTIDGTECLVKDSKVNLQAG